MAKSIMVVNAAELAFLTLSLSNIWQWQ